MFVISGCSDAIEDKGSIENSEICDISFKSTGPCTFQNITVNLDVKKVAIDEKVLRRINVVKQRKKFSLNILKDTSMLDGDKGYISFEQCRNLLNFDQF